MPNRVKAQPKLAAFAIYPRAVSSPHGSGSLWGSRLESCGAPVGGDFGTVPSVGRLTVLYARYSSFFLFVVLVSTVVSLAHV